MSKYHTKKAAEVARIAERRAKAAELMLIGSTNAECAAALGVSEKTYKNDKAAIFRLWKDSAKVAAEDIVAEELQVNAMVRREAIKGWRKSEEAAETRIEKDGENPSTTLKTEGQCGDPRFLAVIDKTIERRLKLTGAVKDDMQVALNINVELTIEQRRTEILGIVAALRERAGVGEIAGVAKANGNGKHNGHANGETV